MRTRHGGSVAITLRWSAAGSTLVMIIGMVPCPSSPKTKRSPTPIPAAWRDQRDALDAVSERGSAAIDTIQVVGEPRRSTGGSSLGLWRARQNEEKPPVSTFSISRL